MKPRDYAVALAVSLAMVTIVAYPSFDRMQGISIDTLFWLRNLVAPPKIDPAQSPSVVVAIDEKTYRTAPFEGKPRVMWTPQMAEVIDALVASGAAVIGFDLVLSTSVEPEIEGYDQRFRIALRDATVKNKVVLGATTLGQQPIQPLDAYRLIVRGNIRALNIIQDADGVARYVPLFFRRASKGTVQNGQQAPNASDWALVPSMSLTLASRLLGVAPRVDQGGTVFLKDQRIPAEIDDGMRVEIEGNETVLANNLLVDLYQGPSSIPTYSLADLYQCAAAERNDFFQRHFEGKAIMVGAVLDVEDRKLTSIRFAQRGAGPMAPEVCVEHPQAGETNEAEHWQRQLIPAVYLHAAAINNIVLGQTLQSVGKAFQVAIIIGLTLTMALFAMIATSLQSGIAFFAGAGIWIVAVTAAFVSGLVLPLFHPVATAAGTLAVLLGYRFTVTDRTERHIRKAFGRILSPSLVDRMVELNQIPTQGGELRKITVWISDLENYTTISESLSPTELVDLLNEVYTVISDTIEEYDGFVAQFVGDAVVAAFGVPLEDPHHARHAVEAAMACCDRVEALRKRLPLPKELRLRIRVGVSTGPLLIGYIGSKRRLSYTIVGDDINLASRLEGVNKIYGSTILVNEATKALCDEEIAFREVDVVRVKGRDAPVRIFEPLSTGKEIADDRKRHMQAFADALAAFRARRFQEAMSAFSALAERDPVAASFASRARDMLADPPPADWDGVNTLLTK